MGPVPAIRRCGDGFSEDHGHELRSLGPMSEIRSLERRHRRAVMLDAAAGAGYASPVILRRRGCGRPVATPAPGRDSPRRTGSTGACRTTSPCVQINPTWPEWAACHAMRELICMPVSPPYVRSRFGPAGSATTPSMTRGLIPKRPGNGSAIEARGRRRRGLWRGIRGASSVRVA